MNEHEIRARAFEQAAQIIRAEADKWHDEQGVELNRIGGILDDVAGEIQAKATRKPKLVRSFASFLVETIVGLILFALSVALLIGCSIFVAMVFSLFYRTTNVDQIIFSGLMMSTWVGMLIGGNIVGWIGAITGWMKTKIVG